MTKRLVDIEDDILDRAQQALGTRTIKDTVNGALRETAETARRRQITRADLQRVGELLVDLGDPAIMAKAWE